MTQKPLQSQLDTLQSDHINALSRLESELHDGEKQRDGALAELEALRARLDGLNEAIEQRRQAMTTRHDTFRYGQVATVQDALNASLTSIKQAESYWRQLETLQQKRSQLFLVHPGMDENLKDYFAFEGVPASFLQSLPAWHRGMLLNAQEQLRLQVSPYLELQEQLQSLQNDAPICLQVVMVRNPNASQIYWLLPRPLTGKHSQAEHENIFLERLMASTEDAILNADSIDGFVLDDVDTIAWTGFQALVTSGQYQGDALPLFEIAAMIRDYLSQALGISTEVLDIQVAEMALAAWQVAEQFAASTPLVEEAILKPEQAFEASIPLSETSQGWYAHEDVVSWQRTVKVVSGSLWNEQARRLRTLLMRMIAKGKVGVDGVLAQLLWESLPEPHRRHVLDGVERMVESGLLVEIDGAGQNGRHLAINPTMLDEAQSLINRDITPFWAGIVGQSEPLNVTQ